MSDIEVHVMMKARMVLGPISLFLQRSSTTGTQVILAGSWHHVMQWLHAFNTQRSLLYWVSLCHSHGIIMLLTWCHHDIHRDYNKFIIVTTYKCNHDVFW